MLTREERDRLATRDATYAALYDHPDAAPGLMREHWQQTRDQLAQYSAQRAEREERRRRRRIAAGRQWGTIDITGRDVEPVEASTLVTAQQPGTGGGAGQARAADSP